MDLFSYLPQNLWLVVPFITLIAAIIGLLNGYQNTTISKNAYGVTPWLFPWGIFVWGDGLVIGPFFVIVALITFLTQDFNLMMLLFCAFWLVRGVGESIYWLNQQFSTVIREKPKDVPFFGKMVGDESGWFMMQIFMQCIAVFALVGTIYFACSWLKLI